MQLARWEKPGFDVAGPRRWFAGQLFAGQKVRFAVLGSVLGFAGMAGAQIHSLAGQRTVGAQSVAVVALHGGTNRSQGYLGIEFRDAPEDASAPLHIRAPHGVEVVMVDHDGPAGTAGLRPHDIIVAMNGQAVAGAEALRRMIHDAGAGVQIALQVVRGGKPMTLSAQLGDRDQVARAAMARLAAADAPVAANESAGPGSNFMETRPEEAAPPPPQPLPPAGTAHREGFLSSMLHGPSTGAVLEAMEPQLRSFFGAPQGMGLLVHSVEASSPAAQCGLRAGDVVLRVNAYALHTQTDWTRRLHAAKGGALNLDVLRDRREFTLTLQPDLKHHSLLEWPLRSDLAR